MRIYGPQTAKLLKENVRGKLHGIGVGSEFVKETPKVQATGAKTDRRATWHQKLLHWKVNNHQLEMATGEMREKDCKPHIHTRFISKTHKESLQLSSKTPQIALLKLTQGLEQKILQRRHRHGRQVCKAMSSIILSPEKCKSDRSEPSLST